MTVAIKVGHVLDVLATLPEKSVQCAITSPPYLGLRAYGTEPQVWALTDEQLACRHEWQDQPLVYETGAAGNWTQAENGTGLRTGVPQTRFRGDVVAARKTEKATMLQGTCLRCHAWRGELGQEPTLALYLDHLIAVFDAVKRVLRDDGTLWVNLADSYARNPAKGKSGTFNGRNGAYGEYAGGRMPDNLKEKDLMLVPHRFAIAMQDAGWYVRSNIIWAKKSCMPESVTDRPTVSHEHVFMFTKQGRYYCDMEAVKEGYARIWDESNMSPQNGWATGEKAGKVLGRKEMPNGGLVGSMPGTGRNLRTVWTLGPDNFPDAHFATFVREIPRRCVKMGTSEKGACPACGSPWRRVVERESISTRPISSPLGARGVSPSAHRSLGQPQQSNGVQEVTTLGWSPTCHCFGRWEEIEEPNPLYQPGDEWVPQTVTRRVYVPDPDDPPPVPCVVLDPFAGAGTTLLVADQLGRDAIGIDLNGTYAAMALRRVKEDAPMFTEVAVEPAAPAMRQAALVESGVQ